MSEQFVPIYGTNAHEVTAFQQTLLSVVLFVTAGTTQLPTLRTNRLKAVRANIWGQRSRSNRFSRNAVKRCALSPCRNYAVEPATSTNGVVISVQASWSVVSGKTAESKNVSKSKIGGVVVLPIRLGHGISTEIQSNITTFANVGNRSTEVDDV